MTHVAAFALEDAPLSPWRNGAGETRELIVWPEDALGDDVRLRLSLATVTRDGPFSAFPGYDRLFVPLGPGSLRLAHGHSAPTARPRTFEPYSFAGEWETAAVEVVGEVRAFNAFLRRRDTEATIQTWRLGKRRLVEELSRPCTLLVVLAGELVARVSNEDEPFELGAGEALRIEEARHGDALALEGFYDDTLALLAAGGPRRDPGHERPRAAGR